MHYASGFQGKRKREVKGREGGIKMRGKVKKVEERVGGGRIKLLNNETCRKVMLNYYFFSAQGIFCDFFLICKYELMPRNYINNTKSEWLEGDSERPNPLPSPKF